MVLAICERCNLLQQLYAPPPELLQPPSGRASYREPERHLDETADRIVSLLAEVPDPMVAGISYKDDSLLERLRERAHIRTCRIDPRRDFGAAGAEVGNERLQALCTVDRVPILLAKHGRPTLVVARHIFEHASDPRAFLAFLGEWAGPGGHFAIEVPDCSRQLSLLDYTMVWEDHRIYLTEDTLAEAIRGSGNRLMGINRASYATEDCLTGWARAESVDPLAERARRPLSLHEDVVHRYFACFRSRREAVRGFLEARRREGRIALFGAGHLACTFVNLFDLSQVLEFVVDDDPLKQGLFLPGSELPIRPSSALDSRDIRWCLLAVNPESEEHVEAKLGAYSADGLGLISIFPTSRRRMPL